MESIIIISQLERYFDFVAGLIGASHFVPRVLIA